MATIDRRGATVSAADPPVTTDPNPDLAIKAPVVVATTGANIALAGVQAIDTITVGNNSERVLVKDQADPTTNGIYTAASGNWTRSVDGANNSQWAYGTQVLVTHGAANASTTWELTAASPIVLGTSAMSFVELGTKQLIPLHVFVWPGDSNASGQGNSAQAPVIIPGTVLQYALDGSITDAAEPLKTASALGQNANTAGSGTSFGNAYYRATGVKVGLVMCGTGATTQTAAADLGSGNWDTTGALMAAADAARVAAMAAFAAAGYAPVLMGINSDVGANDALQIDNAVINVGQYQTALTNYLASWRTRTGNVALPIYIIQTGSNITGGVSDTGYAQVRAAQVTVANADPFTRIVCFNRVDFVARGLMNSGAHPTQAGYNEVGELVAANIVSDQSRIGWQQNNQDIYYTRGNVTVGYPVSSGVAFAVNKSPTVLPAGLTGTVAQFATADGSAARLEAFGIGNGPSVFGRRANGTMATPTRVSSGDFLVTFGAAGYDAVAGWSTNAAGAMAVRAAEDWVDASHHGSKLLFFVTPNGTAAPATALTINQDKTLTAAAYGAGIVHSDASGNLTSSSIAYADIQSVTASRLLGNPTGGAAAPAEISLGATLAFSGTALQTAALTGDVTASANSFATTVAKIAGTTVSGTTGSGNVAFSTSPVFTTPSLGVASATSVTAANLYGGSAAGSTLNLQSTSNGSPSGDSITLTAGGSVRATVLSNGNVGFGTETNPQFPFVYSLNATSGATVSGASAFGGPWAIGATSGIIGWNVLSVATIGNNNFVRVDGTVGSPSNLSTGEQIGTISFGGWGAGGLHGARAQIIGLTLETWTTTFGTGIQFNTTAAGGSRAQAMLLDAGAIISSSSTTDPGAGGLLADGAGIYFTGLATTASAANAFIDTGTTPVNQLKRSTSSRKYKKDIIDLDAAIADKALELRPIAYKSAVDGDDPDAIWYGLIAEDAAAIDPRLVHWGFGADAFEIVDEPELDPKKPGYYRPPVFDEDLRRCVPHRRLRKDAAGNNVKPGPEGVQYERLSVLLLSIVKRQGARIAALEAKQPH